MKKELKIELTATWSTMMSAFLSAHKNLTDKDFVEGIHEIVSVVKHNEEVDEVVKALGNEVNNERDYNVILYYVSRLEDLARRKYV